MEWWTGLGCENECGLYELVQDDASSRFVSFLLYLEEIMESIKKRIA